MSVYNKYSRGSGWNKWDLHIHTPASFFWEGGKGLKDMNDDEKAQGIKDFIDTVNKSDAEVFCIMDYWTFDWYLELQKYIITNPDELKKLVLPGMELRIECPVNYRLNIHCILSNSLSRQELIDFKSELYIRSIDKKLSDDSLIKFAESLDDSKASKFGFQSPETLNNDELLKLGSKTAEITKESLENAFAQIPLRTGYIILPYDTSDGLLNLNWEDHPHDDNYFMQSAHIFESRDKRNIDLFNGKKTPENERFFKNFYKTIGSKPKPCISGSDAHKYSKYGVFPSDKITWIKADPTFEGLKQILYEPELRVRIQPHKPEEKNNYLTIDSVSYLDDDARKVFPKDAIKLSTYLNSIIGGKSSGKSLLLFNIARSIDSDEVMEKADDLIEKYDLKDNSYDFEVVWSDGFVSKMSDVDKDNSRKITYIPQLYISKLVDEKNELIGFNKLILDAIKELDKTLEIDGFEQTISNFYDETITNINSKAAELTKLINDLFNEIEISTKIKEDIKEFGDSSAIKKEVDKKKDLIKELTKKSALTDEQANLMNSLKTQEETNNSLIEKYEQQIMAINRFDELLSQTVDSYKINLESLKSEVKDEFEIELAIENHISTWISNLNTKISEQLTETKQQIAVLLKEYETKLNDKKSELEHIKEQLKPLLEKISNQQQLEELNNEITNQNMVLKSLDDLNKQLLKSNKKFDEIQSKIIDKYTAEFDLYKKLVEVLKKDEVRKMDSIEIQTTLGMSNKRFRTNFTDLFDNRSHLNNDSSLFSDQNELVFDQGNHIKLIKELFTKLLENKAYHFVLKYNSLKDAILKLFENYFEISFDILFKGDNLLQMSPGKIGLVLIHLYLQFSNARYPILVDQPEENLDNRTVYEELVDFIREKKIQRQIIIVTHNPNLVVSTDSEQIIVCNQSGQQVNKDNKEYLFEYVSGSIEFTSARDESKEGILYQMGIREHVCDILEGGAEAFAKREQKYGFA